MSDKPKISSWAQDPTTGGVLVQLDNGEEVILSMDAITDLQRDLHSDGPMEDLINYAVFLIY